MKKTHWFQTVSVAAALVLMALPWSVNDYYTEAGVNGGASHEVVKHFSYFQLDPFMNGHVGPFLTAVLTAALAVVVALLFISIDSKPLHIASAVLSGAAFIASGLCALPNGVKSLTIAGLTVTLLLLYSLVISIQYLLKRGFVDYDDDEEDE